MPDHWAVPMSNSTHPFSRVGAVAFHNVCVGVTSSGYSYFLTANLNAVKQGSCHERFLSYNLNFESNGKDEMSCPTGTLSVCEELTEKRTSRRSRSHTLRYRSAERGRRGNDRKGSRSRSHSDRDWTLLSRGTRKARTRVDRQQRSRSRSRSPSANRERYMHRGKRANHSRSSSASRERHLHRGKREYYSRSPSASRERYLHRGKRASHSRSPSASRDRYLHRGTKNFSGSSHSGIRRSRSRSVDASSWVMRRRRHSPSPRHKSPYTRQRSPSIRSYGEYSSRQRSRDSYRRSPSLRGQSPTPRSHFKKRRSPSFRRSSSTRRHKPSLQERYLNQSPCKRDAHSRNRSRSASRQSHSPHRHRKSQSRSQSRRRQDTSAASQLGSSRGLSWSPNRYMRHGAVKQPQTLSTNIPLKSGYDASTDSKHDVKVIELVSKGTDEHCVSAIGSHEDSSIFHHPLPSQPSHGDHPAPPSPTPHGSSFSAKPVMPMKSMTLSSPQGGLSNSPTPTKPTGGNGSHRLVNTILEKKLEAQRESHRAYLKCRSDYNRAEIKCVSIEAELRLAEFWLGVVTKSLEDVGKRIEVHDWNFQKITNHDGFDVA